MAFLVADLRQMSASGSVSPAVPAFIPSARSSPRSAVAAAQAVAGTPGPGAPRGNGERMEFSSGERMGVFEGYMIYDI